MTVFGYTVNYIDVSIVLILLFAAIGGYKRGMLITVLRFLRWTAGLVLCWFADASLTPIAYANIVRPRALEKINEQIATSDNLDVVIDNLNKTLTQLPKSVASAIDTSSIKLSGDNVAEALLDKVFEPVLMSITRICIIALTFIIFFTVTSLILRLIKRRQRRKDEEGSYLRKTDRLLGAVIGFAKGAVIVLLLCALLALIGESLPQSDGANSFSQAIGTSTLFGLVNNINPFVQ